MLQIEPPLERDGPLRVLGAASLQEDLDGAPEDSRLADRMRDAGLRTEEREGIPETHGELVSGRRIGSH